MGQDARAGRAQPQDQVACALVVRPGQGTLLMGEHSACILLSHLKHAIMA